MMGGTGDGRTSKRGCAKRVNTYQRGVPQCPLHRRCRHSFCYHRRGMTGRGGVCIRPHDKGIRALLLDNRLVILFVTYVENGTRCHYFSWVELKMKK